MDIQRLLIGLGLSILVIGVSWPILSRIGLGGVMYRKPYPD